jgi:hypothetical protein
MLPAMDSAQLRAAQAVVPALLAAEAAARTAAVRCQFCVISTRFGDGCMALGTFVSAGCACKGCLLCLNLAGVEGGITQEQLLANFREDVWSNTCVMLLRFITSAEIKRRVDHFEPFVVVRGQDQGGSCCKGHAAYRDSSSALVAVVQNAPASKGQVADQPPSTSLTLIQAVKHHAIQVWHLKSAKSSTRNSGSIPAAPLAPPHVMPAGSVRDGCQYLL